MPESSLGGKTEHIKDMPKPINHGASKNLIGLTKALRFVNEVTNDESLNQNFQEAFESRKLKTQKEFLKKYDTKRISHYIPLLYMPYVNGSSKLLLYFHANAEDIVLSHDMLDYMRVLLRINIVAVEYPGYGLYNKKHQKRYSYQQ